MSHIAVNARNAAGAARRARHRFALVQLAKAGAGALLAVAFVLFLGPPNRWEGLALVGLLLPAALALAAFVRAPLDCLETLSLVLFAALVGYVAALTGGLLSPILIWLAIVPAEAALAGERKAVWRAAVAAIAAVLALAIGQTFHILPPAGLHLPLWQAYAGSAFVAVLQAAVIAVAAQDRRRSSDLAAAEGAAMYRFLADHATDVITRHGPDGRILFASPATIQLLGMEPDSLVGIAPSSLVHPDELKTMQAVFVEASYFGRAATAEVRFRRSDGAFVWTEMRCRPAKAVDGKAADIVAVTRDISERKAQERDLIAARDLAEQGSRAKSRFLANMSHELRTPLNAIIGFSEVMSHEMFGPIGAPRYLEYVRLIHESGGHLLELINGILDMSKIEAGKFELAEEIFDFEEVAQQAIRFVKLQSDRKGVTLKTGIAADAKSVFADRRAVKQILVNLLSNGVKFTPRGGDITIEALRDGGEIEFAVADSGIGIADADLARLGQPFEQVAAPHVRMQEGTGLGLALVKALAAMHGGTATIHSALGEGTCVRVRLPHAAVNSQNSQQTIEVAPRKTEQLKGAA
ncbi:MAG TPA: PAS domain-containing sensor histidine kinase [Rhizomicrobium sp.]|jgi:cell cycle sensor histidine kinase DivJ